MFIDYFSFWLTLCFVINILFKSKVHLVGHRNLNHGKIPLDGYLVVVVVF